MIVVDGKTVAVVATNVHSDSRGILDDWYSLITASRWVVAISIEHKSLFDVGIRLEIVDVALVSLDEVLFSVLNGELSFLLVVRGN